MMDGRVQRPKPVKWRADPPVGQPHPRVGAAGRDPVAVLVAALASIIKKEIIIIIIDNIV